MSQGAHKLWAAPCICYFGGGGGTTQTVQKSDPWEGQQPALQDIYTQAQGLDQTAVPQYYPGNSYAGLTPQQQGIMSQAIGYGTGGGNSGLQAANSNITSALSPGYTSGTSGAFDSGQGFLSNMIDGSYGNQASGAVNAGAGALTNVANGNYTSSASPTYNQANSVLSNELSPGYLNPWSTPGFSNVVNNTLASVVPATSASFINGGRSDSGLAQRAQTMAATDAVGQLAQNQYNTNQQIQQGAAGLASQNNQNATTNAINAASGANTIYGTIGGLQSNAATQAGSNFLTQQGNQLKAGSLAPVIDQTQMGDITQALNTSGMSQTDMQNQIAAAMARYNYGQMQPWNQLGLYENAITGTGSPGGTTTTQQPYFDNTMANVASGVGTAASAAMIAAMFLSDRRLKTDIKKIGESDSGFPLYSFRYKHEGPMSQHIGLMAQDVKKSMPDAVVNTPVGMAVNYTKALAA